MAVSTITGLTAGTTANLTDAAVSPWDDSAVATRKFTLAQVRTRLGTTSSATAYSVGPNGATNPVFVVDCSTGSQAAGLQVQGATAAGTVGVAVISSGANASLQIAAKGTGTISLVANSGTVTIDAGQITATNFVAGAGNTHSWTGRATIRSPADSVVLLQNNAANAFNRLQFGGTTSSFPSLQRSSTTIICRLADDSANAPLTCAAFNATTGTFSDEVAATNVKAGATNTHYWTGRATIWSPADSVVLLQNNAADNFDRLQLGGTTSSFPSLQRSGTTVICRLADNSANAPFTCAALNATTGVFAGAVSGVTTLGCGAITSTGQLLVTLTTQQVRFRYDASNHLGITVGSTGAVTYDATGSGGRHTYNQITYLTPSGSFLFGTTDLLPSNNGANTATLTNSPTTGNPAKWVPIDQNGTTYYIPMWT